MLVSTMVPISILEKKGFQNFLSVFDPSFRIPCRSTVKETLLPNYVKNVQDSIREKLTRIPYPNVMFDVWSDPGRFLATCHKESMTIGNWKFLHSHLSTLRVL
jgi:hypothetical protein